MSGVDQIHTLTRQYSYRRFPSRSGVWGFTCRVKGGFLPILRFEQALHASVCGNLNNQG